MSITDLSHFSDCTAHCWDYQSGKIQAGSIPLMFDIVTLDESSFLQLSVS